MALLKYLVSLLFPISTVVIFNCLLIWFFCLFVVSYLRLLQVLLDVDLVTEVVCLSSSPGLVGAKPLSVEDGALYPLGSRGAQCLTTVISGLLLQVRIHFVFLSLFPAYWITVLSPMLTERKKMKKKFGIVDNYINVPFCSKRMQLLIWCFFSSVAWLLLTSFLY